MMQQQQHLTEQLRSNFKMLVSQCQQS